MFSDFRHSLRLTPVPVAHLGLRLTAAIVDLVAVSAFLALLIVIWPTADGSWAPVVNLSFWAVIVLILTTYSPATTSRWGGTPGKLLLGLRVTRVRDGRRLSYGRALLRHLSHAVMWLLPFISVVNVALCLWDRPLRQCLHDKIADSVVVRPHASS
ncbi:putative RDD family membrane protein YckC [Nonomuraea thailandensis]|uniref:RDD family membrane protein YckC n=1 Tax=Nonomuraea thailandensis TaxID=1188745 RepID=A0A9X2K2N3_9ACTN|nr:RDD family protein [Nonomuraea thailandensis]MCP2358193.1 putative RDD family membrane protein YckC [Nonomuraea thailandensis]